MNRQELAMTMHALTIMVLLYRKIEIKRLSILKWHVKKEIMRFYFQLLKFI